MSAFFNGLMVSGSLIIAIGAQNAFVLKQGLIKQHVGMVIFLCWLCDVVLMGAGVFGIAALLSGSNRAGSLLSLAGGSFLFAYGLLSAKRALKGSNHLSIAAENSIIQTSATKTAFTTLALTLLNPHVYVDTVMLIGGSAAGLDYASKVGFFIGAITASAIWFSGIGYGTRLLLPLFRRERVWQILDGLIALMMFYLAYDLIQSSLAVL